MATSAGLRLEPIPNPYPLPGSDYSIFFELPPPIDLPHGDTERCIHDAKVRIIQHLHDHPSDTVVRGSLTYEHRLVIFRFYPTAVEGVNLEYTDILRVLDAYGIKMAREGYRQRSARILGVGERVFGYTTML